MKIMQKIWLCQLNISENPYSFKYDHHNHFFENKSVLIQEFYSNKSLSKITKSIAQYGIYRNKSLGEFGWI
jgi:pyoverdine/dityrosine biosynthesis protein Dit1